MTKIWPITFDAPLTNEIVAAIEATGARFMGAAEAVGAGTQTGDGRYTFHVPGETGEKAVQLLMSILDRYLISVRTFAVQSTPVG